LRIDHRREESVERRLERPRAGQGQMIGIEVQRSAGRVRHAARRNAKNGSHAYDRHQPAAQFASGGFEGAGREVERRVMKEDPPRVPAVRFMTQPGGIQWPPEEQIVATSASDSR